MRVLVIRSVALLCVAFDVAAVFAMLGAGWLVGLYEQWRLVAGLVYLGVHASVACYAAVQVRRSPSKALVALGVSFAWLDLTVFLAYQVIFSGSLNESPGSWQSTVACCFSLVVCLFALFAIGALLAGCFAARRKRQKEWP